jgi:hypothetical protein
MSKKANQSSLQNFSYLEILKVVEEGCYKYIFLFNVKGRYSLVNVGNIVKKCRYLSLIVKKYKVVG